MTHDEKRAAPALSLRFRHSGCAGSSSFFSAASPNPGKDQVQCPGFEPQLSRFGFQLRDSASGHAEKMFALTRFFLARANAL
jgi:hypothetical protein